MRIPEAKKFLEKAKGFFKERPDARFHIDGELGLIALRFHLVKDYVTVMELGQTITSGYVDHEG